MLQGKKKKKKKEKSSKSTHGKLYVLEIYNTIVCVYVLCCFSRLRLFATLWIIAHQAPLSMWFSRQEYWSGLPCPPPGDLPNPGIEPTPLRSPALAGRFIATEDAMVGCYHQLNGHEFEQTLGDTEGQGSLPCCRPWGPRVWLDLVTEQQQPCLPQHFFTKL